MRALHLPMLALSLVRASAQVTSYDVDVSGDRQFMDSGIEVNPGDTLKFTATGHLQLVSPPRLIGPEGAARGWTDIVRTYPVLDGPRFALVARISERDTARAFLIGASTEHAAGPGGRLYLGLNMLPSERIEGVLHVHIERSPQASAPTYDALPLLTLEQIDTVPARVTDRKGDPGDRVNFFVIGSEAQLQAALAAAGWTKVDVTTRQAVVDGFVNVLSKQAYVALPMSELTLFGRVQDYGYAQGDPLRVVTSRHHFRIWKAPFTVGGRTVWAGAATHDIGIERDHRNHGITHKIDPDIDLERDYVAASFAESGLVVKTDLVTPIHTVTIAKTASGEGFHSDGRTVILYLVPENMAATSSGTPRAF